MCISFLFLFSFFLCLISLLILPLLAGFLVLTVFCFILLVSILSQVMGRLSDAGTTVLCSVERRGDDGVPRFLDACEAEGFERRMVYRSAPGAPAPIELYELSKGGQEGFRGVAVESEDVSSSEVDGGDGDDDGEGCSPPGEEKAGSTEGSDDVIER